ncbi:MAG TPA: DinB family protein [Vicinamibacterales bacterium]|nr:DinB family protein [Vicinamibacterales bacterium]
MPIPYSQYVGDQNPVDLLTSTLEEYRDAAALLSSASWNQPWAPHKWTLREIMVHVAQWEMIFGYRLACGVTTPDFAIQPADQDRLMTRTANIDGPTAFAAFEGARRMNIGFIQGLSAGDRDVTIRHPEYGALTPQDLITQMAGHGIHHLKQIRATLAPKADASV